MIERIRLIRNVGLFESMDDGAKLAFLRLTLIYAENGRGKTTIAAILRSLGTGAPLPIAERHRLSAKHAPHVIMDPGGGAQPLMFQDGAWNQPLPEIAVFDDEFIDQNVYSGLAVDADHRQNLHELILGSQGIALNKALQVIVDRVEQHNKTLKTRGDAIPVAARGNMDADAFCALTQRPNIDAEIQSAERNLAAAREQDVIRNAALFETIELPGFDIKALAELLARDLATLDGATARRVQEHVEGIGPDGERWVAEGMRLLAEHPSDHCPFCAQNLGGSTVIDHYRTYFSAAYADLKNAVADALTDLNREHGGDVSAAFERAIRVWGERRQFWSRFCDVPEVALDTAAIARARNAARDAVRAVLLTKQGAPLEKILPPPELASAAAAFDRYRQTINELNERLQETNKAIQRVKEQAAAGNPAALAADVARLKAIKARYQPEIVPLCNAYLTEKQAKDRTEQQRAAARAALDKYRKSIFPAYEAAINEYLRRFNAGFRIGNVTSTNTRGGSAITYSVVINVGASSIAVPIGGTVKAGEAKPSFRNTLSAGDRNALALAFFFASLDRDPDLARKIVVIDDPITSLDEHRFLTTVHEIRELTTRASQVIVLSHSKRFLCRVWEGAANGIGTAVKLDRVATGSTLRPWAVSEDLITEHDRRHVLFKQFIDGAAVDNRNVARAIRPTIENFLRVAYPEQFPPESMLGHFVNICRQRLGTADQILDKTDTDELDRLREYANLFHHDTNPAWETEVINDGQLLDFVRRALTFTRKG